MEPIFTTDKLSMVTAVEVIEGVVAAGPNAVLDGVDRVHAVIQHAVTDDFVTALTTGAVLVGGMLMVSAVPNGLGFFAITHSASDKPDQPAHWSSSSRAEAHRNVCCTPWRA